MEVNAWNPSAGPGGIAEALNATSGCEPRRVAGGEAFHGF